MNILGTVWTLYLLRSYPFYTAHFPSRGHYNLHTFGHYKVTIILVNFDNLCILSYTNARQKNGRK